MKLSEVQVIEIQDKRLHEDGTPFEAEPRWGYDFGAGRHEKHVIFKAKDFACDKHNSFHLKCEGCAQAAVFSLDHLEKSRGIKVELA